MSFNSNPIFVFSSRMRHTSWPRDWSSVVCSSDLLEAFEYTPDNYFITMEADLTSWVDPGTPTTAVAPGPADRDGLRERSEERRVGKEWGTGWVRGAERERWKM